ncbi:hypothetical protein SteCoe_916 [Stentor coeruleus]|uniref:Uncharacterized protein n=1 Tax=Stentor coeruleus TaxID=5963 RepID=A0A1R2D323_9CILI|nr:hypothetical protein SteCoe_916 [Stentor coeruleus]
MNDQSKNLKSLSRNTSAILKHTKEHFKISQSPYLLKLSRVTKLIPKLDSLQKKRNQSSKIYTDSPSNLSKFKSEAYSQDSSLSISSSNAIFFQERFESRLEELSKQQTAPKERFLMFLEIFDEITEFLGPFRSILKIIKQGILRTVEQSLVDIGNQLKLEDSYEKLEKNILALNKDKAILVKKINNAVNELQETIKTKEDITKYAEGLERKIKLLELDFDKVQMIENLNKQSEIIKRQTKKIESKILNEMKLKMIIHKLIDCSDANLSDIIEEVKNELGNF